MRKVVLIHEKNMYLFWLIQFTKTDQITSDSIINSQDQLNDSVNQSQYHRVDMGWISFFNLMLLIYVCFT